MEVANLSREEILDALDEIIAKTVSCINDHELGTDGLGTDVRQKVLECIKASGGRNNACAHCGPVHFPEFPSHEIVERAILLIPDEHEEKTNILVAYSVTTYIVNALDRVRIMSLRYGKDDGEIADCLMKLTPYTLRSKYVKSQIRKITSLQDRAAKLFLEENPDEKEMQRISFLNDFSKEKKKLTDFRIRILKKIRECLSE